MPRDGANIYVLPFPDVVPDTTVESAVYNGFTNDVANDLNTPRPIVAGGTGASSAAEARIAMGAETAGQIVTNYDSHMWEAGSFWSAALATGAPNTHAFSGIVYMADSSNIVVEARDQTDGVMYVRRKVAGTWGAWVAELQSILDLIEDTDTELDTKVAKAGDTMTGHLVLPAAPGDTNAVRKDYVDAASLALTNAKVAKAGDTMTGALVLSGSPANALEAAPKQYVDLRLLIAGGQTTTGGFKFTGANKGTVSSGTFTPTAFDHNYQYYSNGGAHTFAAPADESAMDILITNISGAGAITFSGFTVGSTGDPMTTTVGHKFIVSVRRIATTATYIIKALQ